MLFYLFFIFMILGIIFPKSRGVRWLLVVYLFVVMALNSDNPDTHSYMLIYQNPELAQEEFGFVLLCKIFSYFGFSYELFHAIVITSGLVLLINGINKLLADSRKYLGFVLAMYMIYPMILDIVFVRTFLSSCIVVFGLHYLMNNNKVKYIVVVLFAVSIHYSAIFFLLFLLKDIKQPTKNVKRIIAISAIGLLVILKMQVLQNILTLLGANTIKIALWLGAMDLSWKGITIYSLLHLINFLCFIFIKHYRKKYYIYKNDYLDELEKFFYVINIILLINIVFTLYADQFLRILGVGVLINSIYYAYVLHDARGFTNKTAIRVTAIISPFMMFLFRMFAYSTHGGQIYFEYIFKTIMDNNILFR